MLSESGQAVFDARYAGRDDNGNVIETFEQAVKRLAHTASKNEKSHWQDQFEDVIGNLLFIPSTPIWANIGKKDRPWQPAACFVMAVEDSLDSMYQTLKDTAMIFKSGGGVGYNFSTIRPKGDMVRTTKGKSSGIVELIKLYDASSNMVMQGGVRRGASMGILNVDHPEILDFINVKTNGSLTNFNLSVGVCNSFMKSLQEDKPWDLKFNNKIYRTISPVELWEKLIRAAYQCGDPGIVFVDRFQEYNPVPSKYIDACNPCGEQFLHPGESCLLGSVNLAKMVSDSGILNTALLINTIAVAVRFLDNLIDIAEYPLPQIDKATKATRKIGLGFTGLADALIKSQLAYDSEQGRSFAKSITKTIQEAAHEESVRLAKEKGAFPDWDKSIFYPKEQRRNAACITIAPTGSVTTMAGCEGYGIEPIFAVAYKKSTNVAGDFKTFSPLFVSACKKHGISNEVLNEVARKGTCQGMPGIPQEIASIFKGAQDISPQDHVLMQAAVQEHVDNAVSKTINLPTDANESTISDCYKLAYAKNLRGITVFRDGSKEGAISVGEKTKKEVMKRGDILPRPKNTQGTTHRLDTGCGKIYLTINYQPVSGEILETFITTGSDGGCLIYTEAASRLISLAIRGGIAVNEIIEQLEGTHSCPAYMMAKGKGKKLSPGKSCASAIAKKLEEITLGIKTTNTNKCPTCSGPLRASEGCMVCACGYSKC